MNLVSSWSGGKDSCYALMIALKKGYSLKALLNIMNENNKVSRSHGLSKSLLNQQAKALNIPLVATPSSWNDYEFNYVKALKKLKDKFQVEAVVFGDIDLEPHKQWEEKVCNEVNLNAILPLWQKQRRTLVFEMIDNGIKAIITSCNTTLGTKFLGKEITKQLVLEMEALGVDACGENGEYHTIVVDCPLFSKPVDLPKFIKKTHENYCFLVWDK